MIFLMMRFWCHVFEGMVLVVLFFGVVEMRMMSMVSPGFRVLFSMVLWMLPLE